MDKKPKHKILLIDDDEITFSLLKSKIDKEGYLLIWAKDGEEGISRAFKECPDLVITDLMMPKVNGFEVLKTLKQRFQINNTKYIILTNYGETRMVYENTFLKSLGVYKYLIKSNHTPTELMKEIKAALG